MTLNSLDIQNKTFNNNMRGYARNEVDEFLDIVVRDYDDFSTTIKDQDRELKTLREQVKYFDAMKDSLNKSIVVAQDAADNLRTQAQAETNSILAEAGQKSESVLDSAKKEAALILGNASDDARRLVKETDDLKRKMRVYHQRMTLMVEAQLESIKSTDWEELLKPVSTYIESTDNKLKEIIETQLSDTSLLQTPVLSDEVVELEAVGTPVAEPAADGVVELTDKVNFAKEEN